MCESVICLEHWVLWYRIWLCVTFCSRIILVQYAWSYRSHLRNAKRRWPNKKMSLVYTIDQYMGIK